MKYLRSSQFTSIHITKMFSISFYTKTHYDNNRVKLKSSRVLGWGTYLEWSKCDRIGCGSKATQPFHGLNRIESSRISSHPFFCDLRGKFLHIKSNYFILSSSIVLVTYGSPKKDLFSFFHLKCKLFSFAHE